MLLFSLVSSVTAAKRSVSLIPFLFLSAFFAFPVGSSRSVHPNSRHHRYLISSFPFLDQVRPLLGCNSLFSIPQCHYSLVLCLSSCLAWVSCFALRPSRLPSADSLCQVTTRRDSPCTTLSSGDFAISLAAYIAHCLHAPPAPLFFHKYSLFNTLARGNDLIFSIDL